MNQQRKPHISPSAIETYLRCGEAYRRQYVLHEPFPPNTGFVRGRAVHRAAEVNYKQKIESREDLDAKVMQEAAAAEVHEIVATEGLSLLPEEATRGLARVKGEIVDRAVALTRSVREHVAPKVQPVLVEQFVRIPLAGRPFDLLGRLDVADDRDLVRDLKTSSRRKSQDELDRSPQLVFYHAAFRHVTGRPAAGTVLDVLVETKTRTPAVQTLTGMPTEADRKVFLARLNAVVDGTARGAFPPAPVGAWWCSPRWCQWWGTCPFVNGERAAAAEANDSAVP